MIHSKDQSTIVTPEDIPAARRTNQQEVSARVRRAIHTLAPIVISELILQLELEILDRDPLLQQVNTELNGLALALSQRTGRPLPIELTVITDNGRQYTGVATPGHNYYPYYQTDALGELLTVRQLCLDYPLKQMEEGIVYCVVKPNNTPDRFDISLFQRLGNQVLEKSIIRSNVEAYITRAIQVGDRVRFCSVLYTSSNELLAKAAFLNDNLRLYALRQGVPDSGEQTDAPFFKLIGALV